VTPIHLRLPDDERGFGLAAAPFATTLLAVSPWVVGARSDHRGGGRARAG